MCLLLSEIGGAELFGEDADGSPIDLVGFLEYGPGNYWDSEKFIDWFKQVLPALKRKYPFAEFYVTADQSTNHKKKVLHLLPAFVLSSSVDLVLIADIS